MDKLFCTKHGALTVIGTGQDALRGVRQGEPLLAFTRKYASRPHRQDERSTPPPRPRIESEYGFLGPIESANVVIEKDMQIKSVSMAIRAIISIRDRVVEPWAPYSSKHFIEQDMPWTLYAGRPAIDWFFREAYGSNSDLFYPSPRKDPLEARYRPGTEPQLQHLALQEAYAILGIEEKVRQPTKARR